MKQTIYLADDNVRSRLRVNIMSRFLLHTMAAVIDALLSLNLVACLVFLAFFYLTCEWLRRRNLPPGPFSLPLLGSVGIYGQMAGGPPHVALEKLAKQYGDIFSVWVGPSLLVVLNGYEVIHQAYVTQGSELTDRPNWMAVVKKSLREGKGVSFSNGEEWQVMRKFCLQSMRDFGVKAGEIEGKILEEVELLQQIVRNTHGQLTTIGHVTQMAVSNVISSIVFGQRFEYDDTNLHDLLRGLDLVVKGSGFVSPTNFLPDFMHPLFPKEYKVKIERDAAVKRVKELVSGIYEKHEATFDRDNIRDFMDVYIQSTKEDLTKTKNKYFHKGNMWKIIYDIFLAGSETTSSFLEWAFLYMIERLEIQQKCQLLIAEVAGDRPVRLSDKPRLSYIDAVINEVLRLANVLAIGVPRTNVSRDISILGYTILRYSMVVPNIYSAHVDPKYWPDPFTFNPERFLDGEGKLVRKDSFIPFSIGPRNCLGDNLSKMETFLIFTNMLQMFTLSRDEAAEKHDFSPDSEQYMTLRPRHFTLRAVPRL